MRAWDSVTQGGSLRPGPAALTILLIGLLLSLAPVSQRIEATVFDLLAGLEDHPGDANVVLVDTTGLGATNHGLWELDQLPDLLEALRRSSPRLIVATDPVPVDAALPDMEQLATLAELERRNDIAAAGAPTSARAEAFSRQLAIMQRRAERVTRTVAAGSRMRNLVVAVPTFDGPRAASQGNSGCQKHLFAAGDPSRATGGVPDLRRVRAAAAVPEVLCPATLAAGHADFWPDPDGVVRHADLLIDVAGQMVPSTALRAMLAVSFPSGAPPEATADAIRWDSQRVDTTEAGRALLRFYGGGESGPFNVISAQELLRSVEARRQIDGRIVILGRSTPGDGEPVYQTPVTARMSGAVLTATSLSNLLQSDYLTRPAWLWWIESILLVMIGVMALALSGRVPAAAGLMAGLILGVALLAAEAYLLLVRGIWVHLATAAAFTLCALCAIWLLRQGRARVPVLEHAAAGGAPAAGRQVEGAAADEDLDLVFSMLRHQSPSNHVKQRLYDVALEHARRRDLAKAERVLRHLAGIDPDFRKAGEKLQKLAGMRQGASPSVAGPASPPVVGPAVQSASLSGETIGRYEIEQAIGRGAMATVYLGRDPKINRRVAIKTIALAEEFSDSDLANARTQFLREAESAGRLNHPNIISIYDAGEDGPVAYLAMEYFPGKPLSHFAQPGEMLPPGQVLELMARAAEALHYAHGQHVVHRDVKPANMLYDPGSDALKITDFGIARLTDSSRTKTGIILGTPSYMSPEQLAGTSVTGQSDLFSLGVTLYQLLAGHPPFRADSIPKLMQKIAHERHPPIASCRDDLPACVDELLDRALAKEPSQRFANGREMALALRDCCSRLAAPNPVVAP